MQLVGKEGAYAAGEWAASDFVKTSGVSSSGFAAGISGFRRTGSLLARVETDLFTGSCAIEVCSAEMYGIMPVLQLVQEQDQGEGKAEHTQISKVDVHTQISMMDCTREHLWSSALERHRPCKATGPVQRNPRFFGC